jgi:hypothetical protein
LEPPANPARFTLIHLMGYVGAPLIREAMIVAKETFAELRAEAEASGIS